MMTVNQDTPSDLARLKRLFGGLCNNTLSEEERASLVDRLRDDAVARRQYMDYILVHVKLMECAKIDQYARLAEPLAKGEAEHAEATVIACELPAPLEDRSKPAPSTKRRSVMWIAALAASMAFLLVYQGFRPTGDDLTLHSDAAPGDPPRVAGDANTDGLLYVAQISGLTPDVRWSKSSMSHEFLFRVRRGDRLELDRGLVELDYFTGATIILKGPCVFVATGTRTGRLISGELTGQVANGDFALTTPTAEVIDLGTEFGVALDAAGNTDVCVLEGKVRVTNAVASVSPADSRLLEKGMAVRVARGAGITTLANPESERFIHVLPTDAWEGEVISLVGVLSGIRDDRFRLAGVIAADTGESDRHPWLRIDGPGHSASNGYQTTSWHPFVDGVFIPSKKGSGTQIDSANHVADLPPSMGRTWGPVWSRMRLEGETAAPTQDDFWGTDTLDSVVTQLDECQTGMIGLHSNVGITFDLNAIAERWGMAPVEFRTAVRNLDNSLVRAPLEWAMKNRFSASLRLYVDGQLRESRLDFVREDGELTIHTELHAGDRFLTLVCSDAGVYAEEGVKHGHDAFDHVVLIDPVLSFEALGESN